MAAMPTDKKHTRVVALVGPPNSGKSTVFNRLTGANQKVGNFPGVTVERMEGTSRLDGRTLSVVDLPGLYSMAPHEIDGGLDHAVARDYIASGAADLVVNIADATRLEQSIYLTLQLLESGVPCIVALNMSDAAEKEGIEIDTAELSKRLGCPVIPIAAALGRGIGELKSKMFGELPHERLSSPVKYPPELEESLDRLCAALGKIDISWATQSHRWMALMLMEGDHTLIARLPPEIGALAANLRKAVEDREQDDADSIIAGARFDTAHALVEATQKRSEHAKSVDRTNQIDSIALSPLLGIPVFLVVMYLMFTFTVNVGGAFIDFFDGAADTIFVSGFGELLSNIGAPEWLNVLLAKGVGGGIQTVATFIPVVGALYLVLTILEDTGYMARAAFVMDRAMNRIGLPGKAIVPLIVGFGCNVPSIMATRVMERQRDRILTITMAPFMSCGARLAVYALFVTAFFQEGGQWILMMLYLVGVMAAIFTALVLRKTLLAGESAPFMMELPSYRMPRLRDVIIHTWTRLRVFLWRAGQVIVLVVTILNILMVLGTDGSFDHNNDENSILAEISKSATPLFEPMGIKEDNWPAMVGIVTGLFAKEAVVGTLNDLYRSLAEKDNKGESEEPFSFWGGMKSALDTIPENFSGLGALLLDPLNLKGTLEEGEEEAKENQTSLSILEKGFDGPLSAVAYMLFVLLYVPCVAALAAVKREVGWGWMAFVTVWTTSVAYIVATLTYQIGTFSQHPETTIIWIIASAVVVGVTILILTWFGKRNRLGNYPPAMKGRKA